MRREFAAPNSAGSRWPTSHEEMTRPTLEVADILRASGRSFWERHGSHLAWQHRKVMDAIVRCRTATLGGHRDQCLRCGHQAISYNSCRNRHCPKCQGNARAKWLAARSAELLPVPYFHVVFTLPHELSALVLQNKRLLYDLLFHTTAATLLEVARDPAASFKRPYQNCPERASRADPSIVVGPALIGSYRL